MDYFVLNYYICIDGYCVFANGKTRIKQQDFCNQITSLK